MALLAACSKTPDTGSAQRLAPGADLVPLLPTPTLAVAAGQSSVDVPPPPTPIVFPSPTPDDSPGTTPNGDPIAVATAISPTVTAVEDISLESVVLPVAESIPPDATAEDLLGIGARLTAEGDFAGAAGVFQLATKRTTELSEDQLATAQYGLGFALLKDGRPHLATQALEPLAAGNMTAPAALAADAAFQLGQAQLSLGQTAEAVQSLGTYLAANPDMAGYVQPMIAAARQELGDTAGSIAAYEAALAAPSHRLNTIGIHRALADLYLNQGDFASAIAQYDAIHDLARTEVTKGEMTYLAGQAELLAGNTEAAYARFQKGITDYPGAIESYWGLVELVDAEVAVDEFQRGLVDFNAAAYQPAIDAFNRVIAAAPDTYRKDTLLYLAWSQEALGNLEAALAELNKYHAFEPAAATLERAEMLVRAGDTAAATTTYEDFIATYPDHEQAPEAAWSVAELAEDAGESNAADRYLYLAEHYPAHPDAPEAIAQAAVLSQRAGDATRELELWQRLAEQYPQSAFGSEALVWLLRLAEDPATGLDLEALRAQARALSPTNYFALRARDLANGVAPFAADAPLQLPQDEAADQQEAEAWLRNWLVTNQVTVPPEGDLSALSPALRDNANRIVGEKLWSLGLLQEAQGELEAFRQAYEEDALASYQIAIYLRDLGLYRSSIAAAETLLAATQTQLYDAPIFIGRLVYPAYYADLIMPLASEYGFDPRLQFALVRQESLFESFARSFAAAQGLAQVIPDTGAWIAQRLDWPDFENEDLYKPYVGLRFGAYYLEQQLSGFDNLVQVALAAYNGGPGNADHWYSLAGDDFDLFVDTVDFPETRDYIKRIYQGFSAYRDLYGQ